MSTPPLNGFKAKSVHAPTHVRSLWTQWLQMMPEEKGKGLLLTSDKGGIWQKRSKWYLDRPLTKALYIYSCTQWALWKLKNCQLFHFGTKNICAKQPVPLPHWCSVFFLFARLHPVAWLLSAQSIDRDTQSISQLAPTAKKHPIDQFSLQRLSTDHETSLIWNLQWFLTQNLHFSFW